MISVSPRGSELRESLGIAGTSQHGNSMHSALTGRSVSHGAHDGNRTREILLGRQALDQREEHARGVPEQI